VGAQTAPTAFFFPFAETLLTPPAVSTALEALRTSGLRPGARVLALAHDPAALASRVEQLGFVPVLARPDAPLALEPGSVDAAILVDALERTEWDRWLLQQVRCALVEGAPLVLVARNLWSLATPGDALELVGRIGGELARRARARLKPGAPPEARPFRGRRYRGRMLCAMLERLGFEVASCTGGGTRATWLVRAHARERRVLACAEQVTDYEREHADFVRVRDAWAAAHPQDAAVEVLDPAAYAGAVALVLAPHPDDEIIGCGGTILGLVKGGCRVVCVQATDGSDGWALRGLPEEARRTVRMTEARAVARAAGIAETDEWLADNRAFRATPAMVTRLAALLRRLEPRLVFTPFLTDAHLDHRTLNQIAADAIVAAGDAMAQARVLGYEVWALVPANVVSDVTAVRAEQEALLRLYENAMKVDDFIEMCERRNSYNACRLLGRAGSAEAFHGVPARDYPALVAETYQRRPTASV
jgi:LmbE family N-acetylglucosaminyl deacetylase